jgi:hypothetical protein
MNLTLLDAKNFRVEYVAALELQTDLQTLADAYCLTNSKIENLTSLGCENASGST